MSGKNYLLKISKDEDLQISLFNGLNILSLLIKEIYGPSGKNIIFDSNKLQIPELSKDGNYIIKNFLLRNKLKSLVILLVEEAFRPLKSDGTNTFFLISSSMIVKGIRFLTLSPENLSWCEGMQKTIHYIFSRLETNSQPLYHSNDLQQVIRRFLTQEKLIGSLLSEIFTKQNINAGLDIELNIGGNTYLEKEKGMRLNYGYNSPYFLTDSDQKIIKFNNPYILIANYCLKLDGDDFAEWLEPIIYKKRPLLIISPSIEEDLLSTLILNKLNGIIDVAYIQINTNSIVGTSNLDDIAIYTNSDIIKNDRGWKKIKRQQLGETKEVIITNTKTLFIRDEEQSSSTIQNYYNQFQSQALLSQSEYETEKLLERQKNFIGTRSKLKLGGATLLEVQELRNRIEASISSIQNCLDEGIIVGGATSFIHIGEEVENWSRLNLVGLELIGARIVNVSVQEPITTMLNNHNLTQTNLKRPSVIMESIKRTKNSEIGYDLETEHLVNMNKQGIIDSVSTLRKGLSTSLSLALMMLSITHLVY
uniref:60-kDa chaperonin n=1 Tax=Eustigmatophyceae sp. Ndem 8/9T-3m6.8 TaxID=2506146 RepID=A0A410D2C4_9STRA|nr:60-kDa chaperonin [Eustigmatophyceae sp. Ndem 8/9T-3m6.8]QAA11874.1 60-kDa chaperonin [Eustigmatophyceae sp. Ndem 8/9T-3m6.8]